MTTLKKFCLTYGVDNVNYPRVCTLTLETSGKDMGMKKKYVFTSEYSDVEGILDKALDQIFLAMDNMNEELKEIDWREHKTGKQCREYLDTPVPEYYHKRNLYVKRENMARIARERAEREKAASG